MPCIGKQVQQQRRTADVHVYVLLDFVHGLASAGFRSQVDDSILALQGLDECGLITYGAVNEAHLVLDGKVQG